MSDADFSNTASIGSKTFKDAPIDSASAIIVVDELMYEAKKMAKIYCTAIKLEASTL